ncbi:MAG: type II toxin-antitoxin system HipA family toxin [Bacteriovorax sp.]|nr:type II toxin-antitoxin system HipA family toxin [Bacteriovorax sp.]
MNKEKKKVQVLEVKLDKTLVGYLAGYADGKNLFTFAHEYIEMGLKRPTLTLNYYNQSDENIFREPIVTNFKLHPIFSNLLPEKELKKLAAQRLKIADDNELEMLIGLGRDLPGSIVIRKLTKKEIPPYALEGAVEIEKIEPVLEVNDEEFSLAGIMMKFSMYEENGIHRMSKRDHLGNWIVKTPSITHKHVPLNEFTAMKLAEAVGISIPEIKIIKMNDIIGLPDIKFGDEEYAFAIKRFDRNKKYRIHSEDFAQIIERHPKDKYGKYNYATLANIIKNKFPNPINELNEFFARLVVNLMIGNGDAHLKNWSVVYFDKINPKLSDAYDIVFTRAYTTTDNSIAFNIGGEKETSKLEIAHFKRMAENIELDWKLIERRISNTIKDAKEKWPKLLIELPMHDSQKEKMREYWKSLKPDFRIDS